MINLTEKETKFLAGDLTVRFDSQEEFIQTMNKMIEAGLIENKAVNHNGISYYQLTSIGHKIAMQMKQPQMLS